MKKISIVLLLLFGVFSQSFGHVFQLDTFPRINQNVLRKRTLTTTGFIPSFLPSMARPYARTKWELNHRQMGLRYIPESLLNNKEVKIVSPDIKSWDEAEFNNPQYRIWLLLSGDYSKLGIAEITNSGSKDKIKVIRPYLEKRQNPLQLLNGYDLENTDEEIIVDGFRFRDSKYITISGFTFGGENTYRKKQDVYGSWGLWIQDSKNIVAYNCLFKKWANGAGARIINADYNTIQRCLFKDPFQLGPDTGGVLLFATKDREARGNTIVACEFKEVADGIGMTFGTGKGELAKIGELPATVIANNDFYIRETHPGTVNHRGTIYEIDEMICGENAIDIKMGTSSSLPSDKIIIAYNRMEGYRPTDTDCGGSGSGGEAIVLHLRASNILVYENIIFNSVYGIFAKEGKTLNGYETDTENLAIVNNLFWDMYNPLPKVGNFIGAVGIKSSSKFNFQMYFNTFYKTDYALDLKERWTYRYQCNSVFDSKYSIKNPTNKNSWSGMNTWYNYPSSNPNKKEIYAFGEEKDNYNYYTRVKEEELSDYTFFMGRITGIEAFTVKNVVPNRTTKGPKIEATESCNCMPEPCKASWKDVEVKKKRRRLFLNKNNGGFGFGKL